MTDQPRSPHQRVLRAGDPGIPVEGVVLGRGGGFLMLYHDIVLLPSDIARFSSYEATYGGTIPEDYASVHLLFLEHGEYERTVERLARINFRDTESPPATSALVEYVVLAQPEHGVHAVVWGAGATPRGLEPLVSLTCSMRAFVAGGFVGQYGCTAQSAPA